MRSRILLAATLLFVAGCSGSDEVDVAASTTRLVVDTAGATTVTTGATTVSTTTTITVAPTTSTVAATTSTVATTTSTVATTTTTTSTTTTQPPVTTSPPEPTLPPPPCAGEPETQLPDAAVVESMVAGDLDGDGELDQVQAYSTPGGWGIHVVLASGWETDRPLSDLIDADTVGVAVVAVRDVGAPAALLELGGTLIGPRFGFFVLDDCVLTPVPGAGVAIQEFVVGGGLHHQWQFTCASGLVTQVRVELTGGEAGDEPETITLWEYGYEPERAMFSAPIASEDDVSGRNLGDILQDYPDCTA